MEGLLSTGPTPSSFCSNNLDIYQIFSQPINFIFLLSTFKLKYRGTKCKAYIEFYVHRQLEAFMKEMQIFTKFALNKWRVKALHVNLIQALGKNQVRQGGGGASQFLIFGLQWGEGGLDRHSICPKLYTTLFRVEKNLRQKERKFFQNLNRKKLL